MHLQENTLFDLDLGVTGNAAQYHLQHLTNADAKLEVATSNGLGDVFTRKYNIRHWPWVKVTRNAVQYPLHHVTYVAANVNLQRFGRRCIYK